MNIIWRLSKDAKTLVLDENLFLFKFANKKDKQRVLDGSLWSFQKNLLAFTNYDGDLRIFKYEFKRACFWIRVFGLPLNLMNQEVAYRMGSKLEILQKFDKESGGG